MLCRGKELVLLGHISDLCTLQILLSLIFEVLKAYLSRGKKSSTNNCCHLAVCEVLIKYPPLFLLAASLVSSAVFQGCCRY